jgi:hypothetical protein
VLYKPFDPIPTQALRREIEAARGALPTTRKDAVVATVIRGAGSTRPATYPTLTAACAAAPADRDIVVEIHDNGPFFEGPLALTGRRLTVRAGKGYRPLIIWDVRGTLDERKSARKETADPLSFLVVRGGALMLEGVDVALRWPESSTEAATLLDLQDSDLSASDCTFSVAGKHPSFVTLVRLRGAGEAPAKPQAAGRQTRCRLSRCHVRGSALVALDAETPTEVLFENCLVVSGQPTLLRVRADSKQGATLRAVGSTFICGRTLLEVKPAQAVDKNPAVRWLGWDCLLSRTSAQAGGELLVLRDGIETEGMQWRAYNCLYAGWQTLLAGAKTISADELGTWQRHWKRIEGDVVVRDPWPGRLVGELADRPASAYLPEKAVGFASSGDREKPLGCDLGALPVARENWLGIYEPPGNLPESLTGAMAPVIPTAPAGVYNGERLNLIGVDLGRYLSEVQKKQKLGPRVVMQLTGKGESLTSPIRIRGSTLVLCFLAEGGTVPGLRLAGPASTGAGAMIEVDGGNLVIMGGRMRCPDGVTGVPYLIRVHGGDLQMLGCRVEGPQPLAPASYRGLIALEGSGNPAPDTVHGCAIERSVLVSGRAGVVLSGVGTRLLMRQTLLVAGTEGLHLLPGPACKGKANMQCLLDHVTVAAQRGVVRLGDAPEAGPPGDPVRVQTRDCAFLNPFFGRPNKAGMLLYEGTALPRGLLVWQSQRDAFDRRLHFSTAQGDKLPDSPEEMRRGPLAWRALWGSSGMRDTHPDLIVLGSFEAKRWPLERLLSCPAGRGANLRWLDLGRKRGR